MSDDEKNIKEFIFASKPTAAEQMIQEMKKEKHDLKYELYILRQRVDKLEKENEDHKKCYNQMNNIITMQFGLTTALCDLTKGLAEDVARLSALMKEENKNE